MSMPVIRLRQSVQFPANVYGGTGIAVSKVNGNYTIDIDYSEFGTLTGLPSSTTTYVLSYDTATHAYVLVPAGNFLLSPSNAAPAMDWVASAGVSALYSRGDHVHPSDTTRAATTYVDTQDALRVAKTGDTMTGNLGISNASPNLGLFRPAAGTNTFIGSFVGANPRWQLSLGDATPETGANVGSNFSLSSFSDTGAFIASPVVVTRVGAVQLGSTTAPTLTLNGSGANLVLNGPGTSGFSYGCAQHIGYLGGGTQYGIVLRQAADVTTALLFLNAAGSPVGTINTTATATAYNTSSDVRLKEDLKSFDAGRIIDDTEVYNFKWKSTGERSYGVAAQQANEVFPEAVTYIEKDDWWGINYQAYVPILLQELKALRARVADLEAASTSKPARTKQ